MKIVDDEFLKLFANYPWQSQSKESDPVVIVKLFNPAGSETWFLTEYDAEHRMAFGYVTGMFYPEWGSISLDELEAVKLPLGFGIERDRAFQPKRISVCLAEHKAEVGVL